MGGSWETLVGNKGALTSTSRQSPLDCGFLGAAEEGGERTQECLAECTRTWTFNHLLSMCVVQPWRKGVSVNTGEVGGTQTRIRGPEWVLPTPKAGDP